MVTWWMPSHWGFQFSRNSKGKRTASALVHLKRLKAFLFKERQSNRKQQLLVQFGQHRLRLSQNEAYIRDGGKGGLRLWILLHDGNWAVYTKKGSVVDTWLSPRYRGCSLGCNGDYWWSSTLKQIGNK